MGAMPALFIGNVACDSHHGLAAIAVHSREAGYIYATVYHQHEDPCKGRAGHTFFDRRSFSAALSSIALASSLFSFPFSSSRARSRFASDTSMPPNLAFQFYSVASEMPCLRARSAVFIPASCSFRTAMICSSVNRFLFIVRLLRQGRTLIASGGNPWWQVRTHPIFKASVRWACGRLKRLNLESLDDWFSRTRSAWELPS